MYAVVYSLGATRCIILHLATSESLQHVFGAEDRSLVIYSLAVAAVALALVQVRGLASLCFCADDSSLDSEVQAIAGFFAEEVIVLALLTLRR